MPLRNHLKVLQKLSCETEKETNLTVCIGKITGSMTNVCKIVNGIQKALKGCFSSSLIIHKERNI